eukprot:gene921-1787_t
MLLNLAFTNVHEVVKALAYATFGIIIGIFVSQLSSRFHSQKMTKDEDDKTNVKLLLKPDKVPRHIAVIMDGNRRYGRAKMSDPLQGHWAGGQTLVDFVQWCMLDGVEILTVYAFSTENWGRDPIEVSTLMAIFAKYAETFKHEALTRNVRVRVLSTDMDHLPPNVQASVTDLENSTKHCTGFCLNICLSYGARAEIASTCRSIAQECVENVLDLSAVNESLITTRLLTSGIPDPDILIRTSGEMRTSNFLLWQLAYTELFFISKHWPEVTQKDLRRILYEFCDRQRRFGK